MKLLTLRLFTFAFDGLSGVVESIRDGFNNELYFPGTGNSAASWQPESIVAYPSARFIGLTYNGDEMVAEAHDAQGRRVLYGYEEPAVDLSRLETVTDAEQSAGSSPSPWVLDWNDDTTLNANPSSIPSPGTQLVSITDPRGNTALVNRFDTQGRVDRQTLANTGQFNYEYDSTDPDCSGQTKLTDPNDPIASRLNQRRKYVASRTLREVGWAGSSLLGPDLPAEVRRLKAETAGELQVHGSCGLVQSLLQADLVDELHVLTFPVILGSGRRLFGPGTIPAAVELVASQVTPKGVVIATYRRDGEVKTGSFELPDAT